MVDGDEHKAFRDRFFSSRFVRRVGTQFHVFDVLSSPLYTASILPKQPGLPTSASRALLFDANLQRVGAGLHRAVSALKRIDAGDTDAICEKANTIRRYNPPVLGANDEDRTRVPGRDGQGLVRAAGHRRLDFAAQRCPLEPNTRV